MNNYMFYTSEGNTLSPNGDDIENLQILGFEEASDSNKALKLLLKNNSWIIETGFSISEIQTKQILANDVKEVISDLFDKYMSENLDPREVLKFVLIEIGLDESKALLIALEAGGSQCKVTKTYLKELHIKKDIFTEVYEAVKYFYCDMD